MLGFEDCWELLRLLRPPMNFRVEEEEEEEEERILFQDSIAKALKGELDPLQQDKVVVQLENDPKLVYNCGLTPKNLPDLVENNSMIAAEVLIKLANSPEISEYFGVLVNMETILHSMDVVNRLIVASVLPTDFLYAFISNCFSVCRGIKEKYTQIKLVRLVCVFLQCLVRAKTINVDDDIFIEVETFCTEFSKIREAALVFKLMKQTDRSL